MAGVPDWSDVLRSLTKTYGQDIAQDALVEYLKRFSEIQHGLGYFHQIAKHCRAAQARRRQPVLGLKPPETPCEAVQLLRVILEEAHRRFPELFVVECPSLLDIMPLSVPSKPTSSRVNRWRVRNKLKQS
jgi:DNA-directed RNA polymerase specialized sigma24 family protein